MCFFLFSIKVHEEKSTKQKVDGAVPEGALPVYLLDREGQTRAKVLSNMIKQKRKEKAVSSLQFVHTLLWRKCICGVNVYPIFYLM